MAQGYSGTTTCQCGGGGLSQQDGTNGVGDSGSWPGVSEGLRERDACGANYLEQDRDEPIGC
jgi:hypothetical protein